MARIKFVLNERRLALIEAQKQVRGKQVSTPKPDQGGSLFEDAVVEESAEPSSTSPTSGQQA